MYNTTTILTPEPYQHNSFHFFSLLSMTLLVGGSIFEFVLYHARGKGYHKDQYEESDEEEEEEDEEEREKEDKKYTNRYYTEFEALETRELSETELSALNTKIVREQVAENVEVILTFDKDTDTFWYYTNHLKEVSYDILETVARKFAIEYDCKKVCLLPSAAADHVVPVKPATTPKQVSGTSIFAKFKNYNTGGKGSTPNFNSGIKVVEQRNHFRFRGKLADYEEIQKKIITSVREKEEVMLDYASYKTLCKKVE
jgi:hypothetical protein